MILPARRDIQYDRRLLIILLNYGFFRAYTQPTTAFYHFSLFTSLVSVFISSIPAFDLDTTHAKELSFYFDLIPF